MNIFVVDACPIIAAQNLCDAHVCKMIVEACQLLSTQDYLDGWTAGRYKATHVNHPCRKCLENRYNYSWLSMHLASLLNEYTYRFERVHKCQALNDSIWERVAVPENVRSYTDLLPFTALPKCMPYKFRTEGTDIHSVVESYRNYYRYKSHVLNRFKYTKRQEPEWLKEEDEA